MKNGMIRGSFGVISKQDFETILGLYATGTFTPVIDSVYPLEEAHKAHERVESGSAVGKVLLRP
jgi:NADPH:quinone reductase-like Zn-dependent oxidoreductase